MVISLSVSVGDLGQEGRRGLELCSQYGETVCVAREKHTRGDRKNFMYAALFLLLKGS